MRFGLLLACLTTACCVNAQSLESLEQTRVHLPNGWSLTPAGRNITLGDLPLNMAVSKDKKYIAVTNNGQSTQMIQLVDVRKEMIVDSLIIPKSWYGLSFSTDGKSLYASGGNDNWILKYNVANGKLSLADSIILGKRWPNKISPAGLAVDDAAKKMFVVTKEDNSLYVVDLSTKKTIHKLALGAEAYTCLLSNDKKTLFISLWGGDKVLYFNTATNQLTDSVAVGDNPNELTLSRKGTYLYVANANDNSVSVIDVASKRVDRNIECSIIS